MHRVARAWIPHRWMRNIADCQNVSVSLWLDVHARKTARGGGAARLRGGVQGPDPRPRRSKRSTGCRRCPDRSARSMSKSQTGFGLARAARAVGIEMMVCAPGAIPRQPGDRVKTDTRDALKLAQAARCWGATAAGGRARARAGGAA